MTLIISKYKNILDEKYIHRVVTANQQLGIDIEYINNLNFPMQLEANDNIIADDLDVYGRNIIVQDAAFKAFKKMQSAATQDKLDLRILSAFRTVEYQQGLILNKLKKGQNLKEILSVLAPPGFSENHTGRALDLTTTKLKTLTSDFDKTEEFAWLINNANNYNFYLSFPKDNQYGMIYEPWHWCFKK